MQRIHCGAAMGFSHPICGDVYIIQFCRENSVRTASVRDAQIEFCRIRRNSYSTRGRRLVLRTVKRICGGTRLSSQFTHRMMHLPVYIHCPILYPLFGFIVLTRNMSFCNFVCGVCSKWLLRPYPWLHLHLPLLPCW